MRVLAISEHFPPRVGGTSHFTVETARALSAAGVDLHLLAPGPRPSNFDPARHPYRITWVDVGYPASGEPTRASRYQFCVESDRIAREASAAGEVDVVHVLFGLFVMEMLDTAQLRALGAPSVVTVHNIPPKECGLSWPEDRKTRRLKEFLRLRVVAAKNRFRLRRHDYSLYVTPSRLVGEAFRRERPGVAVEVVPHGHSEDLASLMAPPADRRPREGERLELLTLAGWVPHKRQHLVPEIAQRLRDAGVDFRWRLLGPRRVGHYKDHIDADLKRRGLEAMVETREAAPFAELPALYDAAHLYVQPSTEEGFCLSALDAAASGLQVIACRAGALPEIAQMSGGALVASDPAIIANAIMRHGRENRWATDGEARTARIRAEYSWARAAERLIALYRSMRPGGD